MNPDTPYLTIKSATKALKALISGGGRMPLNPKRDDDIIIMANGPSLSQSLTDCMPTLQRHTTMAVNFAAIAPSFFEVKPQYYVLADPHFFGNAEPGSNLEKLRESLRKVQWPLTLFAPSGVDTSAYTANPNICIKRFHAVGIDGAVGFAHWCYRLGLGMPRPRNVLIPSIMLALAEGFRNIYIVGADHSWMKTISVTDNNEVVSVQPHFYTDSRHEQARVNNEYRGYRLHQIVESFSVAFRSYHQIRAFADTLGARIINATPESFIDAFERGKLPDA